MNSSNLSTIANRSYDDDDAQADQILRFMEHLKIPEDQLQFDVPRKTLGQGGFGIVERAVIRPENGDQQVVVVKRIPGRAVSFNRLKKRTGREILIWSKLSHPSIIPFLGYEWKEEAAEVWLVCPWQANGTVHDYLNASLAGINKRMRLIIQSAEALNYLHSLNPPICHGDIKGANVLVTDNEGAMLTDFGLSRMLDDSLSRLDTTHQFQGSIPWCSPELFQEDECIRAPPCDVWAWAWLVTEIITGKVPFSKVANSAKIIFYILERKWTETAPDPAFEGLSDLWNVLLPCWTEDPSARAKISQCLMGVKAVALPQPYTAPENCTIQAVETRSLATQEYNSAVSADDASDQESDWSEGSSSMDQDTGASSRQEADGHLAPPARPSDLPRPESTPLVTGRERPSPREGMPRHLIQGHKVRNDGDNGASSPPSGRRNSNGRRSPSPSPQSFRPDLELRETGEPRNLTSILSKHQWKSLRKYKDPNSIFRTSLIPGSQVMAIVCVTQVYRTKDEKKAVKKRLMRKLRQHRRKMTSPHISHWVGFALVRPWNYACLVRYEEPGSLRLPAYLEQHPSVDRLDIVRQIASGLECLHSAGVVHGDLRAHTFVVTAKGVVQAAGFGLAELLRVVPEDLFTIRVSALEVLRGSPPTTASDVYAFANVTLEVLTGCEPFVKMAKETTVLGALHNGVHSKAANYPDFPGKDAMWGLFKRCWEVDPSKRPTMAQVNEMLSQIARGVGPGGDRNTAFPNKQRGLSGFRAAMSERLKSIFCRL